jgi:hypothetical protein
MSDLEVANKPFMRPMLHGRKVVIEPSQQKLLAHWAVLKAVVLEHTNRRRPPFYTEAERTALKPPSSFLPVGTSVWIAKFSNQGLHAGGTDVWRPIDDVPKAAHGCVTNIVVGRLVVQVLTVHVLPRFASRHFAFEADEWRWDISLCNIWPVFGAVNWPPRVTFGTRRPNHVGRLINRWKIGEDIG